MQLKLYRGTWCAVWYENGTRRASLRTTDEELAKQYFEDFKRQPDGGLETVGDIFPQYLNEKRGEKKVITADYNWKALKPMFAALRPDQVTREKCREYVAYRVKNGIGLGTIHREIAMLSAALRWKDKNTKAVVEFPKKPPPKDISLTKEEFDRLLESATTPHVRLFIILALNTGGRASAILDLTWDRVDFGRNQIDLRKGDESTLKKRALVPMTKMAREELLTARKAAITDFVIEYGGTRVLSIKKGFAGAVKRAGLKNITPHVLRHTAAVWMAEGGVSMSLISQFLGHSSTKVTESVYARYSPDYLREASKALERFYE